MPLEWTEPSRPNENCPYDHVTSQTPLGEICLEWKGWKKYDDPCGHMPWNEFVIGHTLDAAKMAAQAAWDKMAVQVAELSTKGAET